MGGSLFSDWVTALTKPTVEAYEGLKSNASNQKTLTGIIIAAVISAIVATIVVLTIGAAVTALTGFGVNAVVGPTAAARTFISSLVNTIVGFYVFVYVLAFVSRQFFGGPGEREQQSYLIQAFYAPVIIITSILTFIPIIGWLVALVVGLYALLLITRAVQAGQGFDVGKSIISWILAGIAAGIVVGILGAISGGWL